MSALYINYFDFDAPSPIPQDPERTSIPAEIILKITSYVTASVTSDLKTLVSWGSVCRFTLAACIDCCARFRNFLLFSQLPALSIRKIQETQSVDLYADNKCTRSDAEGVTFHRATAGDFKHLNYFNLNSDHPVAQHIDMLDVERRLNSLLLASDIKEALFLGEKLIIVTRNPLLHSLEGSLFFFEIGRDHIPHLRRHVLYKGDVGFLNNTAYVIDYTKGECRSLDIEDADSDFQPCTVEIDFARDSKFITSSDHLYHLTEKELQKLERDESGDLVVTDTITLPLFFYFSFPVTHTYFIYKNWFVYPSVCSGCWLCIIDLSSGKIVIDFSDNVAYPQKNDHSILIKDDFLFLKSDQGENICIHVPTKRHFTREFNQFISPILRAKKSRLVDIALLQSGEGKPVLRLLLASEAPNDQLMHRTWTIDLELNQQKAVGAQYKTYWVAAAVFLTLGIVSGALFQHFHLAPYIPISMDNLLSLPAVLSLSVGLGVATLVLIIASVKRTSCHR